MVLVGGACAWACVHLLQRCWQKSSSGALFVVGRVRVEATGREERIRLQGFLSARDSVRIRASLVLCLGSRWRLRALLSPCRPLRGARGHAASCGVAELMSQRELAARKKKG